MFIINVLLGIFSNEMTLLGFAFLVTLLGKSPYWGYYFNTSVFFKERAYAVTYSTVQLPRENVLHPLTFFFRALRFIYVADSCASRYKSLDFSEKH